MPPKAKPLTAAASSDHSAPNNDIKSGSDLFVHEELSDLAAQLEPTDLLTQLETAKQNIEDKHGIGKYAEVIYALIGDSSIDRSKLQTTLIDEHNFLNAHLERCHEQIDSSDFTYGYIPLLLEITVITNQIDVTITVLERLYNFLKKNEEAYIFILPIKEFLNGNGNSKLKAAIATKFANVPELFVAELDEKHTGNENSNLAAADTDADVSMGDIKMGATFQHRSLDQKLTSEFESLVKQCSYTDDKPKEKLQWLFNQAENCALNSENDKAKLAFSEFIYFQAINYIFARTKDIPHPQRVHAHRDLVEVLTQHRKQLRTTVMGAMLCEQLEKMIRDRFPITCNENFFYMEPWFNNFLCFGNHGQQPSSRPPPVPFTAQAAPPAPPAMQLPPPVRLIGI